MSPSEEPQPPSWLERALALNQAKLEKHFHLGQAAGAAWLVECRDLWDAHDDDAGVYFESCVSSAAVDALLAQHPDNSQFTRILGIYDLTRPLSAQGPGMKRQEWVEQVR